MKELTIPVVGVIAPGARAAVQATRNHRIGDCDYGNGQERPIPANDSGKGSAQHGL